MNQSMLLNSATCLVLLFSHATALAWGKRGHAIINETAAQLISQNPGKAAFKDHAYDLGYYSNVPDIVWKSSETYDAEWYNHFMDLEIFERAFTDKAEGAQAYNMSRIEFNEKYKQVENKAGRSWWRIREFNSELEKIAAELKKTDLSKDARFKLQAQWLVFAGTMGHYIGDLAQPLHVTENYDGQASNQKGVHSYFEEALVDELFPGLQTDVMNQAQKQWAKFSKDNQAKSLLELLQALSTNSFKQLDPLLKADKKSGREDAKKAAAVQKKLITDRLSEGALYLTEIWRRNIDWEFDNKKFYNFVGQPAHVPVPMPPKEVK